MLTASFCLTCSISFSQCVSSIDGYEHLAHCGQLLDQGWGKYGPWAISSRPNSGLGPAPSITTLQEVQGWTLGSAWAPAILFGKCVFQVVKRELEKTLIIEDDVGLEHQFKRKLLTLRDDERQAQLDQELVGGMFAWRAFTAADQKGVLPRFPCPVLCIVQMQQSSNQNYNQRRLLVACWERTLET